MSAAYFLTGTDTEVGKTAVACALLEAAWKQGLTTAALKPVAAGCDEAGRNEDALQLMRHTTLPLDYTQVNPVALAEPIAPHIAAVRAGVEIEVAALAARCGEVLEAGADFCIAEGAGGWRVPVSRRETLADLAVALDLPVILVVGMRLGCLNHALLTAEAIRNDGLRLAGWVANQAAGRMDCYAENLATLKAMLPAPLLGELPHLQPWDAAQASKHLDISPLLAGSG